MTVVNGTALLEAAPIKNMQPNKVRDFGVSYGLGEAGYDIRIKQDICFTTNWNGSQARHCVNNHGVSYGRFCLASAIEEFQMPVDLVGVVHDKSTWARKGLSVFNTVIEPGWSGFLTLELVYHGSSSLIIPAGAGIAQVIFSRLEETAAYNGKYQHQADKPVSAKFEN